MNTNSQRRNPSRTDVFANSFIHGKKVDSPKIYLGNKVNDDRPKTSAQQTRKLKTKETKDAKKKANHVRKNATALNASQVVANDIFEQYPDNRPDEAAIVQHLNRAVRWRGKEDR